MAFLASVNLSRARYRVNVDVGVNSRFNQFGMVPLFSLGNERHTRSERAIIRMISFRLGEVNEDFFYGHYDSDLS